MSSISSVRHARYWISGWTLVAIGVGAAALLVPASALFAQPNDESFNKHVGWANILALTVGGIGAILVILDKIVTLRGTSDRQLASILNTLRDHTLDRNSRLLAHLLGTDSLDNRPAQVQFSFSGKSQRSENKSSRVYNLHEIADFYLSQTRGRLVILGPAGTGKTVLATQLLVDLAKQQKNTKDFDQVIAESIPVSFNLASWDPFENDFNSWVETQLAEQFNLGKRIASRLFRNGSVLPLLDGLDEMDSVHQDAYRSGRAVERINDYIASTANPRVVVISRSGGKYYRRLARKVRDADEVSVGNLDAAQVIEYITDHCEDQTDTLLWSEVFEFLQGPNSHIMLEALGTPWRLTAAVTFFLDGGDPDRLLPTKDELRRSSHEHADHDYTKRVSYTLMFTFIEAKSRLNEGNGFDKENTVGNLVILSKLLTAMETAGDLSREIKLHTWWKSFGNRNIRLSHAGFMFVVQHYPLGIAGYLGFGLPTGASWTTALGVLANYALIMQISTSRSISREKPLSVRFSRLRTPFRAVAFAVGLLLSIAFGWVMVIATNLLQGVSFGIATSVLFSLACTISHEIEPYDETHPLKPLTNDRVFALLIGATLAAYAGLYYYPIYGPTIAVAFGCMCLIGGMLASSYARYIVAVCYGRVKFGLPLRFARFLDWSHSVGLLRASGAGYQFRHQELHEFLSILENFDGTMKKKNLADGDSLSTGS